MVAAPSQLHLPQHGMDAEDSGPLQDFRVRDPVLPSQLQYSAEAAEMKVIQLPGLVRVDGPVLYVCWPYLRLFQFLVYRCFVVVFSVFCIVESVRLPASISDNITIKNRQGGHTSTILWPDLLNHGTYAEYFCSFQD
ncbi:unnamed protein product [Schistocephalus solidus]|uniref:Fibronectin type-III domain-containing protein n=1 Tax=Schistocephalus solidus TaxID=70667 RepID=A0A183SRY3_SCHSO|nr:unnamed protein product [Schistocephalus solidus]